MENGHEIRKRIMNEARECFFRFGYSKVTMDEVADNLGISKKTIYKYFPSKIELVKQSIEDLMREAITQIVAILNDNNIDYMERLKQLMSFIGKFSNRIGLAPIQDLQKTVPEIWAEIEKTREKEIMTNFRNLIQEGIEQGIIRPDINKDIIIMIFVNSIRTIVNPMVLSEMPFSIKEAFDTIVKVVFNGILTEKYRF